MNIFYQEQLEIIMIELLSTSQSPSIWFDPITKFVFVGDGPDEDDSWIFRHSDAKLILDANISQLENLVRCWVEHKGVDVLETCGIK